MPTYSYECKKCGTVFDVFHSISATPRVKCECGGNVRRLVGTGAGIIFKGSGFYETDYKRKPGGGAESKGGDAKGGESKSESKSEGKSESKGESKSESKGEPKKSDSSKKSKD